MRLLVTRPAPDGDATAAVLRRLGHSTILAPLLRIEPLPDLDIGPGPFAGIVVTSRNALTAVPDDALHALTRLPVYAVGDRTAAHARTRGFADVASAANDADALTAFIAGRHTASSQPLLYLAGEDRFADLPAALATHGIAVRTVVVYRAIMAETLPEAAARGLSAHAIDGVLHFSRRTAATYVKVCERVGLSGAALAPIQYCLSAHVAEPLTRAGAARVTVAPHANEAALLDLLPR